MTYIDAIAGEIRARAEGAYRSWHIGETQDPTAALSYWRDTRAEDVGLWMEWEADSLEDAEQICEQFVALGMIGGGLDESMTPNDVTFVYVF